MDTSSRRRIPDRLLPASSTCCTIETDNGSPISSARSAAVRAGSHRSGVLLGLHRNPRCGSDRALEKGRRRHSGTPAASCSPMIRDALLAFGIVMAFATQLSVPGLPIDPSHLALVLWIA